MTSENSIHRTVSEARGDPLSAFTTYDDKIDYGPQRTACFFVSSVLLLLEVYVATVLFAFEHKVTMKNKRDLFNWFGKKTRIVKDKIADWLRRLCLTASVLLVVRLCLEVIETRFGENVASVCLMVRHAKAVLHSCIVTCIYLALWFRQRQFYQQPMMEHLTNREVRFFSMAMIVIMATANVTTITLYLSTRQYTNSIRGCVVGVSSIPTKIPGVFLFVSTLSFQVILLCLFIYPLYRHRRAINELKLTSSSSTDSQKREITLIRRVTVAATVTILTDIASGAISVFVFSKSYGVIRNLIYDGDMLIALLCLVFSFVDWRTRLVPCFAKPDDIVGTVKRIKRSDADNATVVTIV